VSAPDADPVRAAAGGASIQVRVIPRSPRNQVAGLRHNRVLVRVTAPPVDHTANDAVIRLVAETLHVPRTCVSLLAGHTSRDKTVHVEGVSPGDARVRLGLDGAVAGGTGEGGPSVRD
jgi:uncharacterized protein